MLVCDVNEVRPDTSVMFRVAPPVSVSTRFSTPCMLGRMLTAPSVAVRVSVPEPPRMVSNELNVLAVDASMELLSLVLEKSTRLALTVRAADCVSTTLVTATTMAREENRPAASVDVTVTLYELVPAAEPGASKFGAERNDRIPLVTWNSEASAPESV